MAPPRWAAPMQLLLKALSVAAICFLEDLQRWRSRFHELMEPLHVSHSHMRGTEWLPATALSEGYARTNAPQANLRYVPSPAQAPSASSSAGAVERWGYHDRGQVASPRPSTAMTLQHASRWKQYCTISTQTTDLARRADLAIEALHRRRKWEGYCAFPKHVVTAEQPLTFDLSTAFELPSAGHGIARTIEQAEHSSQAQ